MGGCGEGNPVTETHAFEEAEEMVRLHPDKRPVAVFEAPEGGIVRQVGIVGQDTRKVRRR
jgi:hypothetical protein